MAKMDSQKDFQHTQQAFAAHLRDPDLHPAPGDIDARRMGIYRYLVYNNIESFLANGFPVLRSISDDQYWHAMARDFIRRHVCHSPYFLDIGKEFLAYLEHERASVAGDVPFLLELAHYEWVELALDVSTETLSPEQLTAVDFLEDHFRVSPLAWSLSYHYPVHRICADFQPTEPPQELTFLVVYRNRHDQVRFLEINAVTARLLQLLEEGDYRGREVFSILSAELGHSDPGQIALAGVGILEKLLGLSIICSH